MSRPYFEAIRSCDLARLQSVLDDSPSVVHAVLPEGEAADGTGGCTGLHLAVHCADVGIARLLIASGVDLEARNEDGRSALHDSIEYGKHEGHAEVGRLLSLQLAEDGARRQSDNTSDDASQGLTRNFEGVAEILRNA